MHWNDIDPAGQNMKIEYAAADTEAYTLVDGVRLSSAALYSLGRKKPKSWWREHTTVNVYAWLITDGRNTACFDTWEAFAQFCADHCVGTVWWYNAKYDFSHIDYAMLTTGWELSTTGRKLTDRAYTSLHGRQGQRYALKCGKTRKTASRHYTTHMTRHYDLCNIFGGGLDKNLKAFDVRNFDGKPLRKLEMDYQGDDPAKMRAYMDNDVLGLYHLVRTVDAFLFDRWGYRLACEKPDVMTAGGLAKRVLLSYYNGGSKDHVKNVQEFQRWHKLTPDLDGFYRSNGLYRGGITMVNKAYQNRVIHAPIYKYDINSMYPFQMSRMPDPVGWPHALTFEKWEAMPDKNKFMAAYLIDEADGRMRDGMLPMFYDIMTNEYTEQLSISANDLPLLVFADEWTEMQNWYEMTCHVKQVYFWQAAPAHGFRQFVLDNYELKRESKRTGNKVMEALAKLLLNSSYGKLSENPRKADSHREINPETGAVVLVDDDEKVDANVLLSVVCGALITSMARVQLMRLIRETCPVPARDFLYCDTDSIHALTTYPHPDPYTLGALKDETEVDGVSVPYEYAKYLAPKSYILIRDVNGKREIEAHTKGLPLDTIMYNEKASATENRGRIRKDWPIDKIMKRFAAGEKFIALSAMNVRGGKALVPLAKKLCRMENTIILGSNEHPETIEIMEEA